MANLNVTVPYFYVSDLLIWMRPPLAIFNMDSSDDNRFLYAGI
jgi:hypothetical protein